MSWTTALDDIRLTLNDGPTDKIRAFKRVFGSADGSNAVFKTLEFRRITDFTTVDETGPVGIYVNGEKFGPLALPLDYDDPGSGYFKFAALSVPISGAVIEATYYIQYFLDVELETFLRLAQNWLGFGDNYANIPQGLRPAALQYAAAEGYQKLAMRFSSQLSETYRLEDMPDVKQTALLAEYKQASEVSRQQAHKLRDEYYTRQGQSLSPLFGVYSPAIRDVPPRR
jgi:hypothetical protein